MNEAAKGSEAVAESNGQRALCKGISLTITPPLEKHRLDAEVKGTGEKGIVPKTVARIRRGAAGFLAWKSATFAGAFATLSEYSQELCSTP